MAQLHRDSPYNIEKQTNSSSRVCRESREEAFKKYTLNLGVMGDVAKSYRWIDPVEDTIMFVAGDTGDNFRSLARG